MQSTFSPQHPFNESTRFGSMSFLSTNSFHDVDCWSHILCFLPNFRMMLVASKFFKTVYERKISFYKHRLRQFLGQHASLYKTYVYLATQKTRPMYPGQNFYIDYENTLRRGDQCIFLNSKGTIRHGAVVRFPKKKLTRSSPHTDTNEKEAIVYQYGPKNNGHKCIAPVVRMPIHSFMKIHICTYEKEVETLFCGH